jgi:hypothetical protein
MPQQGKMNIDECLKFHGGKNWKMHSSEAGQNMANEFQD